MGEQNLASVCGIYCGTCEYLRKQCDGCGNEEGKPFWTQLMKIEVCPLYNCCIDEKHLEHCGLCEELPCMKFRDLSDPSLSPEEAEESVLFRQKDLIRRREIGTEEWLREKANPAS